VVKRPPCPSLRKTFAGKVKKGGLVGGQRKKEIEGRGGGRSKGDGRAQKTGRRTRKLEFRKERTPSLPARKPDGAEVSNRPWGTLVKEKRGNMLTIEDSQGERNQNGRT